MAPLWDLLVRGGTLVDPAQSISARRDVAFTGGTVAAVAETLIGDAVEVIDATGALVTSGLIDIHTRSSSESKFGLRTARRAGTTGPTRARRCGVPAKRPIWRTFV